MKEEQEERKVKIKIHKSNEKGNGSSPGDEKKFFRITATVLIVLFVIAIIVEIAVILWLKNGTDDLKNKNDKLPNVQTSISTKM